MDKVAVFGTADGGSIPSRGTMYYQKISTNSYIIRIKRGEMVIGSLDKFCQKKKIKNAFFYGIGALDKFTLANYNVDKQKYLDKKFAGAFELANITGNVFNSKEALIIHSHAVLSDEKMKPVAGHFVEGRVSGTVELYFQKLNSKIIKKFDKETGLKLAVLNQKI